MLVVFLAGITSEESDAFQRVFWWPAAAKRLFQTNGDPILFPLQLFSFLSHSLPTLSLQ